MNLTVLKNATSGNDDEFDKVFSQSRLGGMNFSELLETFVFLVENDKNTNHFRVFFERIKSNPNFNRLLGSILVSNSDKEKMIVVRFVDNDSLLSFLQNLKPEHMLRVVEKSKNNKELRDRIRILRSKMLVRKVDNDEDLKKLEESALTIDRGVSSSNNKVLNDYHMEYKDNDIDNIDLNLYKTGDNDDEILNDIFKEIMQDKKSSNRRRVTSVRVAAKVKTSREDEEEIQKIYDDIMKL